MRTKLSLLTTGIALSIALNMGYAATIAQEKQADMLIDRAQTQRDRGQLIKAESSYQQALSIDPLNTNAITGLIDLYRQQGNAAKVQLMVAQLTTAQREALGASLKHIEVVLLQDQAAIRLSKGQTDQAIKYLEQAVQVDADDSALHLKLADLYASRVELSKGRLLLEDFLSRHSNDSDALYILALYQSKRGDSGSALKYLNRIDPAKRTPDMTSLQQRLTINNLGRETKSLVQAGKKDEAFHLLFEMEAASVGNNEKLLKVAFAWAEIGEVSRGRTLFEKVQSGSSSPLEFSGLDNEARGGLVKILEASGKREQALRQLDEWVAAPTGRDIPAGANLANMYADLGEYPRAKKQIDAVLAAHPEATYLLNDAWKIAQHTGHLDDEIVYLKMLVIAEPTIGKSQDYAENQGSPSPAMAYEYARNNENVGIDEFGSTNKIQRDWKEKKLAALIDRRSRWFSSALDVRNRTGTAGVSEYHSVEIPLEYKTSWHIDDEVFFRTDLIKLNAGRVDPLNTDFGGMLLCQPSCIPAPSEQTAQGLSLTAGYQRNDFILDIGITPRNFPVSNTVGGMQYKGDLGQFGYSIEVSRRPVTASFLSFAGTKDPYSGDIWGGVVTTGGTFGLSLDSGETFGFWSSLGLHNLTGHNVQTNRRLQFMAGEQWRLVNEQNRRLVIGLTGMYWDFSENAGEYSFGHGGYYSPHNYRSLSLPVTYTARSPRFSYMLRAAVSASRSQTRESLFYPTNGAMQAQAAALNITPIYTSGSGGGRGYSLQGACEYQATPRFFAGALLAIDRSDYYAPNRALFYIRYTLDHPGAQPVFLPPEPVKSSSQFY